MLWSPTVTYERESFEKESELEGAILMVQETLFGPARVYLDVKKKIGLPGGIRNIPDAYLIDLSSKKEPRLYVVENELAKHEPLKHIAVQILQFSLSFETTPQRVKDILKKSLAANPEGWSQCETYAQDNGLENVDYLLERMIYRPNSFNALVIIDEVADELETVLISRFRFPVEVITLERFRSPAGERIYYFEPFLHDVAEPAEEAAAAHAPSLDPSEIDTIVVPAREDGFKETFLGEHCWHKIRIHSSMIPKIKYIAAYQTAPVSAITHIAPVRDIEPYKDSNKYILYFAEPAKPIGPLKMVPNGRVKAPQASRYTSRERLEQAASLDEAF